jgi:phosphoglycerate dehydrogenase-like enzyme
MGPVAILCDGEPAGTLEPVRARVPLQVFSLRESPPPGWDPEVVYLTEWPPDRWGRALAEAGRLRWLHWAGVGVERLRGPLESRPEVLISTSRGIYDQAMAEYAVMLGLAALRGLWSTHASQCARQWAPRPTRRLADARVVVVGAGSIGRAVGRAFAALGAEVTLVGRSGRDDREFGAVRAVADLAHVVPDADLLVLAVPLTDETRGMVDAGVLSRVGAGAYLVNLARGQVVVEADLIAALTSGRLAGAALDVFDTEPLPSDHLLWSLPGVVVSPHMSAAAEGDWERLLARFVENLDRYLVGEPPTGLVDLGQGFVPSQRDGTR